MDKKFYGLILPNKSKKCQPKLKSVFDSDEDDNEKPSASKDSKLSEFSSLKLNAKNKLLQKKLAEDDPTIYEYDSVYDTLKQNKAEKQISAKKGGSKYISSLLKAADKRKKEQERRQEKKIQDERDKEGDEFKDKEAFVTSAYKQKMLEMQAEEEREKLLEQADDMMDVTKQKDLSGFYRHYLNQTIGEEAVPEFGDRDEKMKEFTKQMKEKEFTKQAKEKELTKQAKEEECTKQAKEKELTKQAKEKEFTKQAKEKELIKQAKEKECIKQAKEKEFTKQAKEKECTKQVKEESVSLKTTSKEDENKGGCNFPEDVNLDADSYGSSEDDDIQDNQKSLGKSLKSQSSSSSDSEDEEKKCVNEKKFSSVHKHKSDHGSSSQQSKTSKDETKSHKHTFHKTSNNDKRHVEPSSDNDDERSYVQLKKYKLDKGEYASLSKSNETSVDPKDNGAGALITSKESNPEDSDSLDEKDKSGNNDSNNGTEKCTKTTNKQNIAIKFAKRTVGEIFDQAQARYFKRKASRK